MAQATVEDPSKQWGDYRHWIALGAVGLALLVLAAIVVSVGWTVYDNIRVHEWWRLQSAWIIVGAVVVILAVLLLLAFWTDEPTY